VYLSPAAPHAAIAVTNAGSGTLHWAAVALDASLALASPGAGGEGELLFVSPPPFLDLAALTADLHATVRVIDARGADPDYQDIEVVLSSEEPPPAANLDVDGNGSVEALADALLALRWLFGFRDASLIADAVGGDCTRCVAGDIESFLDLLAPELDVDGDGSVMPLSDGLLILRYLFGFRDGSLIADAVGGACTRCTADEIETYIESLLP
jgi:hypothetical protein